MLRVVLLVLVVGLSLAQEKGALYGDHEYSPPPPPPMPNGEESPTLENSKIASDQAQPSP